MTDLIVVTKFCMEDDANFLEKLYSKYNDVWYFPEKDWSTKELLGRPLPINVFDAIVTTSPFVVFQFPKEKVFVWDRGTFYNPSTQTLGMPIDTILKRVFKSVHTRPHYLEIIKNLEEYKSLVYNNLYNSDRATELLAILTEWVGSSQDPELIHLTTYIENREWELKNNLMP